MKNCPKCKNEILEDSMFCQYCGTEVYVEKQNICKNCGAEYTDDSLFCPFCGSAVENNESVTNITGTTFVQEKEKKKSKFNFKIASIVILAVSLALAGLVIYQNSVNRKISEENENLSSSVSHLTNDVKSLEKYVDYYDDIRDCARYNNIGYSAYNFHCDTGVVVMSSADLYEKITLTAYWSSGGSVSISNSDYDVAGIDFDNDSWSQSTTLTITPSSKGMSIVEFSNDVDSNTFSIIIIVE